MRRLTSGIKELFGGVLLSLAVSASRCYCGGMKSLPLVPLVCSLFLIGCLTTPVAKPGGAGVVPNTNPFAIITAAQSVFAEYGYTPGPSSFPDSISFDKPAGGFGKLMYGSYGVTTTVRSTLLIVQVPGTNDYQLRTKVSRVSDAGEAGFEEDEKMLGAWSAQFKPLLEKISLQAANAGPM